MIGNLGIFFLAAFLKYLAVLLFGCILDLETPWWIVLGVISLILFAYVLTKIDVENAGRIYAIYGGIYIIASLIWLVLVERESFNRWDIIGASLAMIGAFIIFIGNKAN